MKTVPYAKMSKKQRREIDAAKRGTWGEINPVTRCTANKKAYNRKKMKKGVLETW